ncbi:MAG: penicillin-binding protein 2 [Verrucomicrobiales bacterium]|jgi:penicillin-binding protein 2
MNFRSLLVLLLALAFEAQAQRGPILDRNGEPLTDKLETERSYPLGALGAHFIGYAEREDGKFVGRMGVEEEFDEVLASLGEVKLTIDARIQWVAEEAMREVGRGAAVVLDPHTGEILASVSVPSFNPNFAVDEMDRYLKDKSAPLHDRVHEAISPGSTFLVPVALAGMRSDVHKKSFFCAGGVHYGKKFMKCWIASKGGRHGTVDLSEGLKRSCNCFFYQYGNDTGMQDIVETADLMGFGVPGRNGRPGMVPTPDWLKTQGHDWSDAYTAMTSIGQGYIEATPLQMASVAGTVAAKGKTYEPRFIKSVEDANGKVLVEDKPVLRSDLTEHGIAVEDVELVAEGMWKVVHEDGGTARLARSEEIEIVGRTGTAQTGIPSEPTNAWFIAFGPYKDPKFAVCVLVRNGHSGGRVAAPIARRILERASMVTEKEGFEPSSMHEAEGHFDLIREVKFPD